jgi:hypothetical protein
MAAVQSLEIKHLHYIPNQIRRKVGRTSMRRILTISTVIISLSIGNCYAQDVGPDIQLMWSLPFDLSPGISNQCKSSGGSLFNDDNPFCASQASFVFNCMKDWLAALDWCVRADAIVAKYRVPGTRWQG